MAKPSWHKIEAVLIELLREEGFFFSQAGGETSLTLMDEDMNEHEINLGDFAKQLEERL